MMLKVTMLVLGSWQLCVFSNHNNMMSLSVFLIAD